MKKGYTLIEIVIVLSILAVISGGIFMAFSSTKQAWDTLEARTTLQLELRKAVLRISDDLKQADINQTFMAGMTTKVSPGEEVVLPLCFYMPEGINGSGAIDWDMTDPVCYALVNGTITRTRGAASLSIGSGITGLNFVVLNNSVIRIDVSSQKVKAVEHGSAVVDAALESDVALRNSPVSEEDP